MRRWRKKLGFMAGGLLGLAVLAAPAQAQFHGPNIPGAVAAGADPGAGAGPVSLPDDGSPNAFVDLENPNQWKRPLLLFSAEGMIGITKRAPLNVPLVTTSTNPNTATDVGAIGEPSTVIIAGLAVWISSIQRAIEQR